MTMAGTSYAAAVARPHSMNGSQSLKRSLTSDLFSPPPETFTLAAALMLLQPPKEAVYLVPRSYLENWVQWAHHQTVLPQEKDRLRKALKLVAESYQFELETEDYTAPGPIDNRELSIPGHPLLLRPEVEINQPQSTSASELRRVVSFNGISNGHANPSTGNGDHNADKVQACVVPEGFYELLRGTHGVCVDCEDDCEISFQKEPSNAFIIHHHKKNTTTIDPLLDVKSPIEFRRPVLFVEKTQDDTSLVMSPTSKLLQQANVSNLVPTVEAFPIKFMYSVTNGVNQNGEKGGFLLVSKATRVVDILPEIRRVVAPKKSSSCVRIWSKRECSRPDGTGATMKGDGYELVHVDKRLDGKMVSADDEVSEMTVGEWVSRHFAKADKIESVDILVETRASPTAKWAREELEIGNRLQVGDYVDAQDRAGKWYEAVVRQVTEDTITVHYAGWASKWDLTIRRRMTEVDVEGAAKRVFPPAPLWSHTPRWRDRVTIGQYVDIRQSQSSADRPTWYRGRIRKIARENDPVNDMSGGAELEQLDPDESGDNGNKRALLLLNRTQQVLVESPHENFDVVSTTTQTKEYVAHPPYIRWVSLYGEEICNQGTHRDVMKITNGPATVDYDYDARRGQPVEIMKSWNNVHGSGFIRESIRGVPPAPGSVGLQNLGNSCFLNSVVQCLSHTEPLKRYFLSGNYQKEINPRNPLGSGGQVAVAYGSLLQEIWGGDFRVLAPRLLKKTVASFAPQFNNLYQHDSHEFCSFLMDGLHEDLNRVREKPYVEELEGFGMADKTAAIESWKKHLLRHDSIIVDHCQGMHRSHVTCPICGRESIKFDVYSSISLPMTREKGRSSIPLEECLEKFAEGEQLDEHNSWYCPNCKKHVCALKLIALWSVPDILIFHLKRFTFNQCHVSGSVVRDKIEDTVVFPIDRLDMRPYILGPVDDEAPPVYKLFGVSEHSGSTANSGHYTATVRNSQDGNWYRYNDSHVGSSSGDAAVTGGAYLLFYQREKNTSRWAGMEKEIENDGKPEVDADGFTTVKTKKKRNKGRSP